MTLKPGDIVRLKSGGPAMTVCFLETHNDGTAALCNWFGPDGQLHDNFFAVAALEAASLSPTETLSPKSGDVVVFRRREEGNPHDAAMTLDAALAFQRAMTARGIDVFVLVAGPNTDIEHWNEAEMERLGWVRKEGIAFA